MGKRIGIYLIGLSITAFGISLIILSMVGAGPWDLVAVGLNMHLGLTIGMWSIIAQAMVVLITAFIERKRPQYGSVIAIIIRSWILDFWIYFVFKHVDFTSSWQMQWTSFAIGLVSAGVGIGIYVEAHFPKTPIDGLMIALHNRFGWSLSASRFGIEASAAVLGYLLGGPLGIGTIFVVLLLGKIIQATNHRMKKLLHNQRMVLTKT